uniref:Uncharacterized protein n=1 Tax=Anopheles atroparvus TaxID=41427 RepID=A0A182JBR1_ANOAO
MVQHADHARALVVADLVEDLVDLGRVPDRYLDRVRVAQAVQLERVRVHVGDELRPDVVAREQVVHAQELHERRVALVQPQVRPPFHRDEIAEPLVRDLVPHGQRDRLLADEGRVLRVDQHERLASYSPTTTATRYVDMMGVRSKCSTRSPSLPSVSSRTGMFESATRSFGTFSVMSKVAFRAGSSQQGKQRRASVASNCVTPAYRSSPAAVKYLLRSPVNSTASEASPVGISVPNTRQAVSWPASNCMSLESNVVPPNVTDAFRIFKSSAFNVMRSVGLDGGVTLEGESRQVGLQGKLVVHREHVGRQALELGLAGGRHVGFAWFGHVTAGAAAAGDGAPLQIIAWQMHGRTEHCHCLIATNKQQGSREGSGPVLAGTAVVHRHYGVDDGTAAAAAPGADRNSGAADFKRRGGEMRRLSPRGAGDGAYGRREGTFFSQRYRPPRCYWSCWLW